MSVQAVDVDPLFPAGVVIGVHGLQGDLKVRPHSQDSSSLEGAKEITLQRGETTVSRHQVTKAARHKGNFLLRLDGITSLERAQSFIGCEVLIARDALQSLPEDEFYWFQLEGLQVQDHRYGDLGKIVEIFTTPAHDILVVQGLRGEVLIPVVEAFILKIDEEAGIMHVDLPEGLVPEADSDAL